MVHVCLDFGALAARKEGVRNAYNIGNQLIHNQWDYDILKFRPLCQVIRLGRSDKTKISALFCYLLSCLSLPEIFSGTGNKPRACVCVCIFLFRIL